MVNFTVSDLTRAVDFYERVLGLSKKYQFSNYAGFDCGGVEIGLVLGEVGQRTEGAPLVDFLVEGVDDIYRALSANGINFLKEPQDTAWGSRIALCLDPDGNRLQFVQMDWPKYFTVCARGE